jgi:hypothetical protein
VERQGRSLAHVCRRPSKRAVAETGREMTNGKTVAEELVTGSTMELFKPYTRRSTIWV